MIKTRCFAPVLAAAVLCALGCSDDPAPSADGAPLTGGPPVGHAPNGDYRLPAATLTDWVSYAEQLSAVTIVSEEEIPPPASVQRNGEGLIGRRARVRIDETIWANTGVTPLSGEFDMTVWGWYLKEGQRRPFGLKFNPRLVVGGRYVMALVKFESGWGALTPESIFPVTGDPVATEDVRVHGYSPVAHALAGKTFDELRAIFESTPPDPVAATYFHLPPIERYQAVAAAMRGR